MWYNVVWCLGLAEIASAIGNGASSAVGEDVMLAKIQKKRPLETNEEDEVVLDDVCVDIETRDKNHSSKAAVFVNDVCADMDTTRKIHGSKAAKYESNTQSWMMSSVTRTPHSKSSLSLESLELANVAKEAMGSLARNIMEGGVGMFELLLEKQQQLQAQ